jgi:MFS family permease
MDSPEPKKRSFWNQVGGLPDNFWYANIMEMLERLAFFGVRAIVALYLVEASANQGLEITHPQRGWIFTIWALLQCLIPMVSGGYTDRYGYRKSLAVAFIINIAGYLLMAQSRPLAAYFGAQGVPDAGFWVFMVAACFVATGTAIFKPPVQGTIARVTNEETSSVGWGVFYWVVNIGGTAAPFGAAWLRGETDWDIVFYAAAIVTSLNFLPAFLLYKEPEKPQSEDGLADTRGPIAVFVSAVLNICKDVRLLSFLLIFSMFFLMFMQLWDLLPIFIDEWVDTSDVAPVFGWLSSELVQESGQTKPEMIINIDSASIILLVIPISWLISRMNKVAAMIIGMLISLVGFVGAGATNIGWMCCLMVFIFAIGEMTCSPTFSAYIGLIAPKDKKALYMGYSNMPFAIGWALGNLVSGYMYEAIANKIRFAREYMAANFGVAEEFALDSELLPKDQVMHTMTRLMDGADPEQLQSSIRDLHERVNQMDLPANELQAKLTEGYGEILGKVDYDAILQANQVLWDLHHPYMVWVYLGLIGLAGTIGMIVFYFVTRAAVRQQNSDATAT